jgi:hypothetical protein
LGEAERTLRSVGAIKDAKQLLAPLLRLKAVNSGIGILKGGFEAK